MPMDHPHSSEGLSIPTHSNVSTALRCCCGRNDCALLEHNNVALEGLEKDLETAARLGQVRVHSDMSCSIYSLVGYDETPSYPGVLCGLNHACWIHHFMYHSS